jgi:UDP-glucose 4-epimerase
MELRFKSRKTSNRQRSIPVNFTPVKTLVTGGAGFIGSNLVDRLLSQGHEVVVIDNESAVSNSQFYWNLDAENHKLDINNYADILPLFEGVDYVFHTAAEARVQPSIIDPAISVKTNVLGTTNVLEASKVHKVKRVIYSMTSSVYGNSNPPPHVETQTPDCLSPYAVSKYAGEMLCRTYSRLYGLETASLRYFNVYGDREPSRGMYAPVVSKFINQKKAGEPLTIVGDGDQRRDFTHVQDVVSANILAMTFDGTLKGEVFNVGSGKNYSVNELANLISDNQTYIAERPGEARATLANNSKADIMLGWTPEYSIDKYISKALSAN